MPTESIVLVFFQSKWHGSINNARNFAYPSGTQESRLSVFFSICAKTDAAQLNVYRSACIVTVSQ